MDSAEKSTSLLVASCDGDEDLVVRLLEEGADPGARGPEGFTALHLAAWHGHHSVARAVLDDVAGEVDARSDSGLTPLHLACLMGQAAVARLLLLRGSDPTATDDHGFTALHNASAAGHVNVISETFWWVNGLSHRLRLLGVRNKRWHTPLHTACVYGNEDVARLLVDLGADVGALSDDLSTPLHLACSYGHDHVAGLLVDRGADLGAKTENGQTPLHVACQEGHDEVAALLLDRGADLGAKTDNGRTPLHFAARSGHESVVELLTERGAEVDEPYDNGETALHLACCNGHLEVFALLLQAGARLSTQDYAFTTPLTTFRGSPVENQTLHDFLMEAAPFFQEDVQLQFLGDQTQRRFFNLEIDVQENLVTLTEGEKFPRLPNNYLSVHTDNALGALMSATSCSYLEDEWLVTREWVFPLQRSEPRKCLERVIEFAHRRFNDDPSTSDL